MASKLRSKRVSIFAALFSLGALAMPLPASAARTGDSDDHSVQADCEWYVTTDGRTLAARCPKILEGDEFRVWVTACGPGYCQRRVSYWWLQGDTWRFFTPGGFVATYNGYDLR